MRTVLLIAAAGLMGLVAAASPAWAHYYGWGYYQPYYPVPYGYYPVPYGYYPGPYYAPPPPVYEAPPPRYYPRVTAIHSRHRAVLRRRIVHRPLVNPLLGPLPGPAAPRRN